MSYQHAVILIAQFLRNLETFYAFYFGAAAVFTAFAWLRSKGALHRHDGYVSINGTVWNCSTCGRPPKNLASSLAAAREQAQASPWVRWAGPEVSNSQTER